MDSLRTESKSLPVVLHRIRRHSHTVAGTPIPGYAADGIGSPTETAQLPDGVVTKIDTIQTRKTSAAPASLTITGPPVRMMCKNCTKKCNCFCKKCSLEKVKPYARRENIALRYDENERLQAQVLEMVSVPESIKVQICLKEEKMIALRRTLENVKLRIGAKQKEVNQLDATKPTTEAQFATVFASHQRHNERSAQVKKACMEKLEELETKLASLRYQHCIAACRIFPVKILDVDVVSIPQKASQNWAVVNDSELQQGLRIAIRNSYINDKLRAKLADHLSNGTISLPQDLHPCFAAFTNTLQLVHLLSSIFNFRPPQSLSHHELCIRERWTKDSLDRDWAILCQHVAYLCAFVGMPISEIKFLKPHHNLIALSQFVFENQGKIQKIGSRPMCDLSELHALIAAQRPDDSQKKDDVDESWIFVD